MADKIRLTKTGITAPMYCEPAAVDYWVNERGWVIDPTDQTPPPPGSQPVTHDELDVFGLADLADFTTTGAAVGTPYALVLDNEGVFTLDEVEDVPLPEIVQAEQWRTRPDQSALFAQVTPSAFATITGHSTGSDPVVVRPSVARQTIRGFGAALTDSAAFVMLNYLGPDERRSLLKHLYSPDGLGLSIVRVPMGGGDFTAVRDWTLCDQPNGTISAATSIGGTSISSTVSFPAGTTLVLDTLTNQESFVTGTPSGSGPYTIPLASGTLTKAHASGVKVMSSGYRAGTLTSLAGLGTTSMASSVPIPAGALAKVDTGVNTEFVRVTALSGASSPYTLTLATATTKGHASGVAIQSLPDWAMLREPGVTIPVLKEILAINPKVRVLLTPWSPPPWTKLSLDPGTGQVDITWVDAIALYIVQSILAYQAAGVPVELMTPQNEPFDSAGSFTYYATADYITLVQKVRALLDAAGLDATRMIIGDHHWAFSAAVDSTLADATASLAAEGIAWHAYSGSASVQRPIKRKRPDLDQYMTEMRSLYSQDWPTTFGLMAGDVVMSSLRNDGSAIILWNLALDQNGRPTPSSSGRRGVIAVPNDNTGAIVYNPEYYCLRHASAFVRPGARRIESTNYSVPESATPTGRTAVGLQTVAFANPDGTIVLVCYNSTASAKTFPIVDDRTNAAFTVTMAAGEIATFRWGTSSLPTVTVPPETTAPVVTPVSPVTLLGTPASGNVAQAAGGDTLTFSATVASGTNTMLVVDVASGTGSGGETGIRHVLCDGVPLRFLGRADTGGDPSNVQTGQRVVERWYLLNPAAGARTITVKASRTATIAAVAYTCGNVNQTDPWRKAGYWKSYETGTAPFQTSPQADTTGGATTDLVLTALAIRNASGPSAGTGGTAITSAVNGNVYLASESKPGATGTLTAGFTYTPNSGTPVASALLSTAARAAA